MTTSQGPAMYITGNFSSGNIRVVDMLSDTYARLEMRRDAGGEHLQWFSFRCISSTATSHTFDIINAGEADQLDGWKDYQAVASHDGQAWCRIPTSFDGSTLRLQLTPTRPLTHIASFAPYPVERHAELLSRCQMHADVHLDVAGESVEGRPIVVLRLGERTAAKRACWITARQHPGEPMASWCVEGMLDRLLDDNDPVARSVRDAATIYVVPDMNPDGVFRGHVRTNAAGVDLNRAWQDCNPESSPEVFVVRRCMEETGVDFYLDLHGDHTLPYTFIVTADGVPSITRHMIEIRERFEQSLLSLNPDFQREHGYPEDKPGDADLSISSNYIAEQYRCLSLTLEQPFKNPASTPDPEMGWSPVRAKRMGSDVVGALAEVMDGLRRD